MAGVVLKATDPRHAILSIPKSTTHNRATKFTVPYVNEFGYKMAIHAGCVCNELVSLHNRHLLDKTHIPFDAELFKKYSRETRKYYPKYIKPCRYTDVINDYSGKKKSMYIKALQDLKEEGLLPRDFVIRMFVKPDKIPSGDISDKAPRAIQYRGPKYNLEVLRYVKAFEETVYPTVTLGNFSGTRAIVKGLNNNERAELLIEKASHYKRPLYCLIDHSKFDSTVNQCHLRSTHKKYLRAFGRSARLAKLLNKQYKNLGYTKSGIKYRTTATRMSGDPDTGLGNSVLNGDVLYGWLRHNGITKYDIMLDGDDSIVIIEQPERELDCTVFGLLGFETKFESTTDIQHAEFCRSRLVYYPKPNMIRDPKRVISSTMVCLNNYPPNRMKDWLSAVGMCEMACNQGVPVMGALGLSLYRLSEKQLWDYDTRWRMEHYGSWAPKDKTYRPPTIQARLSLQHAWGLDIPEQVLLEKELLSTNDYRFRITQVVSKRATKKNYHRHLLLRRTLYWNTRAKYDSLPTKPAELWWIDGQTGS